MERRKIRAIISGGGTGGHIFPALSIAGKLKEANPDTEILFVGAEGKMEMEKVPAAGYRIIGLPVAGLQRKLTLSNLALPFKILKSLREQNGFAGLANRILGKKAGCICTAYEGMERFFPADRIVLTGNPIRKEIVPATPEMKAEAMSFYGLDPAKRHIFIVGGSLGSRTLNRSVMGWIQAGCPGGEDAEIIWQCGKYYKKEVDAFMDGESGKVSCGCIVRHYDFIARMDLAYAAADVVVSRSGASSVSELCAAHKAVIFVPSPNVTEDHQTHNAMALVNRGAAMIIHDAEAEEKLMSAACTLVHDQDRIASLENNIAGMAHPDAAGAIVDEIYKLI